MNSTWGVQPKDEKEFYDNFIFLYKNKQFEHLSSLVITALKADVNNQNSIRIQKYLTSLAFGMKCSNEKTVDDVLIAFQKLLYISESGN